MALGRSRRGERHIDYWPGFVDALSTLLLVFVFLLSVFVLAQFVLTQEIGSKDDAMARLQAQIRELTELLALERANDAEAESQVGALRASLLRLEQERDVLRDAAAAVASPEEIASAQSRTAELARQLGE
ncbi:MAG: peptidoglycan-binding protein, partial [Starkeya sp.]|nr:peptidoglycan-binding protein [Starkeya sp.]